MLRLPEDRRVNRWWSGCDVALMMFGPAEVAGMGNVSREGSEQPLICMCCVDDHFEVQ